MKINDYKVSCLICIIFLVSSCTNNYKVRHTLKQMQERTVVLSLDRMKVTHSANADKRYVICKDNYHLCVYIDSTQCSPCQIDNLFHWNEFMDSTYSSKKKLDYVFIVAPKQSQLDEALLSIESCGVKAPVYLDTAYVFQKSNPQIPKNTKYHTFLLDRKGNVLVVGNPMDNENVRKLIKANYKL